MTQEKLNRINSITNAFHDSAAEINEEFVDGNTTLVIKAVDALIASLKDFKTNLTHDEI